MGRFSAILGVWLGGFLLGFLAFLSYPLLSGAILAFIPWLLQLGPQVIGAVVAGVATSFVTLVLVIIWAYSSRSRTTMS